MTNTGLIGDEPTQAVFRRPTTWLEADEAWGVGLLTSAVWSAHPLIESDLPSTLDLTLDTLRVPFDWNPWPVAQTWEECAAHVDQDGVVEVETDDGWEPTDAGPSVGPIEADAYRGIPAAPGQSGYRRFRLVPFAAFPASPPDPRLAGNPYAFGTDLWPGTAKLLEELGELGQVLGKVIGTGGEVNHWDGTDLNERLIEEIGDVLAAVDFFVASNNLEVALIEERTATKRALFDEWHSTQRMRK